MRYVADLKSILDNNLFFRKGIRANYYDKKKENEIQTGFTNKMCSFINKQG